MPPKLFKHGVVRDLAAALSRPSLMTPSTTMPCLDNSFYEAIFEEAQEWLERVDASPQALMAHIEATPRSNRLGLYYESLISYWLKEHPSWKLLAHELPVYHERQTLGAYDFVIQTSEDILHVEVAIKFYMGVRGTQDWYDWIGPGQHDCLGLKMEKMLDKQIRLSQTPAGFAALQKAGIPLPTQRKMWVKGIFFRPHNAPADAVPQGGARADGVWYPLSAVAALIQRCPGGLWLPRLKPDWLSRLVMSAPLETGVSSLALEDTLRAQWDVNGNQPVMWSRLMPQKKLWVEEQRVFFAPDDWLERAQRLSWKK
jgi:hypothetical protein